MKEKVAANAMLPEIPANATLPATTSANAMLPDDTIHADATLPDTIPADIPSVQLHASEVPETQPDEPMSEMEEQPADAQSDHEMDLEPAGDDPMDGVPLTDAEDRLGKNVAPAVNAKSLQKEDSVASTVSLGDAWEKELYSYKEENGKWVKYVKDKYVPLAKARNWTLGPIDVRAKAAPPREKPLDAIHIKLPQTSQQLDAASLTSEPKTPAQPEVAPAATGHQPDVSDLAAQQAAQDDKKQSMEAPDPIHQTAHLSWLACKP